MGKYKGFSGAGMNSNKNVSNVVKQAQKMQEEMLKAQESLSEQVIETSVGGGAVNVKINGKKELIELKIS
ncbi:MAG: YbaB/EbfC family nucleoid-associated protein, partial [Clostridia bacterium]|nr:YbaB/EbfC family nucleoid-associated protein [Clostridia bacterium]